MLNSEILLQKTMLSQNQISETELTPMAYPVQEKPKLTWIEWFCSLEGHEFLVKVDADFIKDKMNIICLNDKAETVLEFAFKDFFNKPIHSFRGCKDFFNLSFTEICGLSSL